MNHLYSQQNRAINTMARVSAALITATLLITTTVQAEPLPALTLYKDQYCGCCSAYIQYLEKAGLKVTAINHPNMTEIKQTLGTDQAPSCHTMEMDGYVIEGHVPLASIQKLWDEQPDIKGIALPGMPMSSPGMGAPVKDSLKILTIEHSGAVTQLFNQE